MLLPQGPPRSRRLSVQARTTPGSVRVLARRLDDGEVMMTLSSWNVPDLSVRLMMAWARSTLKPWGLGDIEDNKGWKFGRRGYVRLAVAVRTSRLVHLRCCEGLV